MSEMTYPFNPLDELRAALEEAQYFACEPEAWPKGRTVVAILDAFEILDAWAERHPGLLDLDFGCTLGKRAERGT